MVGKALLRAVVPWIGTAVVMLSASAQNVEPEALAGAWGLESINGDLVTHPALLALPDGGPWELWPETAFDLLVIEPGPEERHFQVVSLDETRLVLIDADGQQQTFRRMRHEPVWPHLTDAFQLPRSTAVDLPEEGPVVEVDGSAIVLEGQPIVSLELGQIPESERIASDEATIPSLRFGLEAILDDGGDWSVMGPEDRGVRVNVAFHHNTRFDTAYCVVETMLELGVPTIAVAVFTGNHQALWEDLGPAWSLVTAFLPIRANVPGPTERPEVTVLVGRNGFALLTTKRVPALADFAANEEDCHLAIDPERVSSAAAVCAVEPDTEAPLMERLDFRTLYNLLVIVSRAHGDLRPTLRIGAHPDIPLSIVIRVIDVARRLLDADAYGEDEDFRAAGVVRDEASGPVELFEAFSLLPPLDPDIDAVELTPKDK